MSKIYVVQKVGYEYNDEYYFKNDSGGGTPERAYKNLEDAREVAQQFNAETFAGEYHEWGVEKHKEYMGLCVGEYAEDLSDITSLSEEEYLQKMDEIVPGFSENEKWYYTSLPEGLTEDQTMKISKICDKLQFYTIEEVELEN